MEDWGEEIFAEGVGVKWKNDRVGRGRGIQDGSIESLIYLVFGSKITPALQAKAIMVAMPATTLQNNMLSVLLKFLLSR